MDENDVSFIILLVDSQIMSIVVLVCFNVVGEHGFVSAYVGTFTEELSFT